MNITLKLKIGKGMLEIQDNDIKRIHRFSAIYGALPQKCDNCQSDNIFLSYKNPKGNDYYTIACKDCGAGLSFHQKKEGGFYLVEGEKMAKYQKSQTAQNINNTFDGQQVDNSMNDIAPEDIPF